MRWIAASCVILSVGCATNRQITISSKPDDASISIDGNPRGRAPVTEKFTFKNADEVHRVTADRLGYSPKTIELKASYDKPDLQIQLDEQTRTLSLHVTPVPAQISINGKPAKNEPTQDLTVTLPFTVDSTNQWTQYLVQASRPGYRSAEQVVRWEDPSNSYTLAMDTMRKDLSITTTPVGAQVSIDDKPLGASPVNVRGWAFPVDEKTGKYLPQVITVSQPGYDPVRAPLAWDNGRSAYHVDLLAKTKTVRIRTDPPAASVKIGDRDFRSDATGIVTATLAFPPVDAKGTLRTYEAVVSKKTADTDWIPEELTIAWDNGKPDYSVSLREVKTRPVPLLRASPVRTDDGWQLVPETVSTLAMKDVTEGPTAEPPVRITDLPKGSVIDTVSVSPDGQWLLFTTITSRSKTDLRSQIQMTRSDGSGQPVLFGDGKTLDLQPTFAPDAASIVFSSNRGGKHMSIWQLATTGEGGVTQLTSGDTTDLWPCIDSDPKPRLFYEALIDSRPDPRVYTAQLGTTLRTDLTQSGGEQPRVSPKADSVLFTIVNEKTGKRDIYKMSDRGGKAVNLTNTSDADNFDAVWSKDGNKIAFVSDRDTDADGRHNYDIYVLDPLHPDKPVRITTNGSWDDSPAWDPAGKYLYFRSNRGGDWAIWRITLK